MTPVRGPGWPAGQQRRSDQHVDGQVQLPRPHSTPQEPCTGIRRQIGDITSEMEFGAGILIPRSTLSSKIGPGALGNAVPPVPLSGSTGSNTGVYILPNVGIVYTPTESPLSFGFAIFEIGEVRVNYPVYPKNPILDPQVPFGRGIGPLYTQFQLLQSRPPWP